MEPNNSMKPKYYTILSNAIEAGCRHGVTRAFKHTEDPSYEAIENECFKAIMESIHEVFEFEHNLYED